MSDAFLPGNGFDTYESQDKVLMRMTDTAACAVAVRILQQQGFAVAAAVVRLADTPEEHAAAEAAKALAKKLDEDIGKLLDANENLSVTKAAVFCAMDYLDEYKKSTGSAENMRSQIQSYIADAAHAKLAEDKAKAENETLRRENAALREQLARLKAKQDREKAAQTEQEQEKQREQNVED